jgi:hypothetical protein
MAPPQETVQAECQQKLNVSCWECRGAERDAARRHALLRAVPECGQVGDWSKSKGRSLSRAVDGWERVGLSSQPL